MSRILFATVPVRGHIAPLLPLARALISKGHVVRWYTGSKYRAMIQGTGAEFVPYEQARDVDDARLDEEYPERGKFRGVAQLKYDMKHVFIDAAPGQLADVKNLLQAFPADVVVNDTAMIGAVFHHEQGGPPTVTFGVVPMIVSSVDTAPFGLGLEPSSTFFGRVRNRALNWFVQNVAFRDVQTHWNGLRARLGLKQTGWWMDHALEATTYVQPSVPGFEYPRSDLGGKVHFVGMMPGEAPANVERPPFWDELAGGKPVVHVTQGTVANTAPDLIGPALEGLANEDVLVVISTGNRPIEALGLGALPKNARIAKFLSYPEFLPKTSVMVTNGGYGGAQMALSHGVPLVVAGSTEDKPEVAARVSWSGAGINLKTSKPTPESLRRAVRAVLDDARYRERAGALAREYASYDSLARAIEIVEGTAARRSAGVPRDARAA